MAYRIANQLVCFFLTLSLSYSQMAQASEDSSSPITINIVSEKQAIAPNESFWVSLQVKVSDPWHAYWKNPGDAGMAPSIDWNLPEGFTVELVQWPVPEKFVLSDAITFGYTGDLDFLALIKAPSALNDQEFIEIDALTQWVICSDDTCLPAESKASLKQAISQKSEIDPVQTAKIQALLAKVPKKLNANAIRQDDFLHVTFDTALDSKEEILFFPEEGGIDFHKDPCLELSKEGSDRCVLLLKVNDESASQLKGLLVVGDQTFELETPITAQDEPIAMAESQERSFAQLGALKEETFDAALFALAIGLAFIGGMILNLMPCVLPVVSFKIMSFVKMSGESRGIIFKHGLAFTAGVLLSFWALAGLLLMLKAYGHSVGWGFQLQEPLFVAILAALLLIFGLSQFGVFELGTSMASLAGEAEMKSGANRESYTSSLMSGVFATTVATPCTGPFLGSAVGYAVTLPPLFGMIIFTFLGLGMAFPYIALSAFPSLLRWMPKPGAWMESFKQFMGFLMLATVLWLVWVFGAETSESATILLLSSFLILSLGCWIYGKWGTPVRKKKVRLFSYALVFACALAAFSTVHLAVRGAANEPAKAAGVSQHVGWENYSEERVAELRAKNIPVFIDFTAKWCLICQANHLVLTNASIEKKMDELGVVKMKADWTKKNPIITEKLSQFGRSGVPLYLLYGFKEKEPQILPQVLTPENVIESLNSLKSSNVSVN